MKSFPRLTALAIVVAAVSWSSAQAPTPAPPVVPVVPVVVPTPDPVSVPAKIEGRTTAKSSFVVYVTLPDAALGSRVEWKNAFPVGAVEPEVNKQADGRWQWLFLDAEPGVYEFHLTVQVPTPGLDPFADLTHRVTVGQAPQPPPGPGPSPPEPAPAPTAGKRTVLLVYETLDVTPAFSRLVNGLRIGTNAAYLKSKGHALHLIDDDAVNGDGAKAALLAKYADSVKFPRSLIVADTATGAVIAVGEVTDNSTAAGVVDFIKQNGG